jgi:glycogen operon protein
VSYNEKHNDANGEGSNDGESHNRSWNCGAEGPTDDEEINELRSRQQRNFLTTLLLSQGVPMICHGDEMGRTQQGNNNVYCQDNELSWIDWASADTGLIEFTRTVSALRAAHPVFRRRRFFSGRPVRQRGRDGMPDIAWFAPDGSEMSDEDWETGYAKSVAVYLNGQGIPDLDERGQRVTDDSFLLWFNAHHEPIDFALPPDEFGTQWVPVLYTAAGAEDDAETHDAGTKVTVDARSVMVLRSTSG